MPLRIVMVDPEVGVSEPNDELRVLNIKDPETGITVQVPLGIESCTQIAQRLEGRSIVVPGPVGAEPPPS